MTKSQKTIKRNPFTVPAKSRKSGKHKNKNKKRSNGKNEQLELLKEAENK